MDQKRNLWNFTPIWNNNQMKFNHHPNLLNSFRMLIVGSSGCGKTFLLLKMLLTPNFMDYNNLIIFSTTINQPELQLIKLAFEQKLTKEAIINIFNNQDKYKNMSLGEIVEVFTKDSNNISVEPINTLFSPDSTKITSPNNLKRTLDPASFVQPKNAKHLIIFDDVINNKNQDIMKQYYTRGRHNNCNCIYLSQNYFDLDKNNIRNNSNFFIFFKLNKTDKSNIYRDIFSSSFDKEQFDEAFEDCTSKKYGYLAYNKETETIMDSVFEDYS